MCDPVTAITLISTLGGVGAQQHAMRKQDRETATGIMRQATLSREADRQVGDNITKLAASNPDDERAAAQTQFMTALRQASAQDGADTYAAPGAVSSRYTNDASVARKALGNESAATAGRFARIDAPINQRIGEQQDRADTASRLSMLDRDSAAQDFLTRLRTSSIAPNPWVMAASELGQGVASGMARNPRVPKKPKMNTGMVMDAPTFAPGNA